jgi:transposase, IS30 family
MYYKHFSKDERNEISILLKKGYSIRDIALVLKKNHSSVSREIKRGRVNGAYDPKKAHHKAYVKRKYSKYCGMKVVDKLWLEAYVEKRMKVGWSPEQIAGRLKLENNNQTVVSAISTYQYLYSSYGQHLCRYLKYKRYKKRRRTNPKSVREIIKNYTFIDQRPEYINNRSEFGHFEDDTMGVPRGSRETLVVLAERKSRFILAKKVSRLKKTMNAFKELLSSIPGVLSLTLDNSVENVRYKILNVLTFFCHPYHSWEKGSVENAIGLIREYIPKKAYLENYSQYDISAIVDLINNTPRKCLGWKTPPEVFNEQYVSKFTKFSYPSGALRGLMQDCILHYIIHQSCIK